MVSVDIDYHDDPAPPAEADQLNERYAVHLSARLTALGFRPIVATWGSGSLHVDIAAVVPGRDLKAFGT